MNDTVIFLVLAGLALVFKWLTSQASSEEEKPPPAPNERTPVRRAPSLSEEEKVRRFLEALGAPPGTAPPPPVRPRPAAPPPARVPRARVKRSWAQPLPPLVTTPEETPLPPLTTAPPFAPVVVEAAPPPPLPSPLGTGPAVPAPRRRLAPPPPTLPSLGTMLRARGSLRRAIILREVLGPPRGLQAIDNLQPST